MHQHLKSKKALREFSHSKNSFNLQDVKTMQSLEASVYKLEDMMDVYVPKKLVENLLKEVNQPHD
jgi:intergrase/recombinase